MERVRDSNDDTIFWKTPESTGLKEIRVAKHALGHITIRTLGRRAKYPTVIVVDPEDAKRIAASLTELCQEE